MATEVTVTDLPEEMLVKIFSFLDVKQLPKLFLVCSKFNTAAKDPSLWKRWEFKFHGDDSTKISSFCSFFSQYPFLRALSITDLNFCSIKPLDKTSVNSFNQLFENVKHLSCLNLEMKLADIVLPPSLRHFNCRLYYDACRNDEFPFLDQCPNIERLHLKTFRDSRVTNAVSSVLLKYQLTLSAFYLNVTHFEDEWIPFLANCLSLKELGLAIEWDERRTNLYKLFRDSLSSRLEILYVQHIDCQTSFDNIEWPELKILTVEPIASSLSCILPIIKRMPKLDSFSFYGTVFQNTNADMENLCSLVKSCKALSYFLLHCFYYSSYVKDDFEIVTQKLNEGSSEENRWDFSYERGVDFELRPSLKCNCWNPTKISIDQSQYKQLRLLDHMDEDPYEEELRKLDEQEERNFRKSEKEFEDLLREQEEDSSDSSHDSEN